MLVYFILKKYSLFLSVKDFIVLQNTYITRYWIYIINVNFVCDVKFVAHF